MVLFLFGRWLFWRPEMSSGQSLSCEPIGLAAHPGDDPVLLAIEAEAAGAQAGIRLIERLARFLRAHGPAPVSIAALATAGPMAMVPRAEPQAACEWLVTNGHAAWADGSKEAISMPPQPARHRTSPRRPRTPATLVQSGGREIELRLHVVGVGHLDRRDSSLDGWQHTVWCQRIGGAAPRPCLIGYANAGMTGKQESS